MRSNQSPSLYSIYHNALPYYLDRIDLCSLDEEGAAFANHWIYDLLENKLNVQANASSLAADKLRHLYFESKNFEKTHGAKSFGFGYPLLVDTFESDLVVAPLFIWMPALEPAQGRVDSWIFKFGEGHDNLPNYQAFRFLKDKYDLDLLQKAEELAYKHQLNRQRLDAFCNDIAQRLQLDIENSFETTAAPGIDEIGTFTETGAVLWSGILSLFPPQHFRWQPGKFKPEDVFQPASLPVDENAFVFPYQSLHPDQVSALETAARQKMTVIESGNAGRRMQTIISLIINALSEGKKCLIVSERAAALKQTQNLLAKTGLGQLHYLLDDALNDKMPMVELLRVAAGGGRPVSHSEDDFQQRKNKYLREKAKVDAAYRSVRRKIFGNYDWTETTGLFLASNRIEGKELLASQLNGQDFEFSIREYEQLKQGVSTCKPLFEQVKTLTHPLSNLNDHIFRSYADTDGLLHVQSQLKTFLGKASQLQHHYIAKADSYAAALSAHYREHYDSLASQLNALKDKMAEYGDGFGSAFLEAGSGRLSLSNLFSSKKKRVQQAREDVARRYQELVGNFTGRQYFDFQFQPCKDGFHVPKTLANIRAFDAALAGWNSKLENIVQEEVLRLNSKTAHPALDQKEQITELEYSLDVLLEELNEAKLYQKPFENKTLTILQRQKYLEGVIEQMESTQLNLRDFENFYNWQSNWLTLSPLNQKVVKALVKVKAGNWLSAFESWYFNFLLNREMSAALPTDEGLCKNSAAAWHELKPLLLNQVLARWQNEQVKALKNLKRQDKNAYRLIFEKQGQKEAAEKTLGAIFDLGHDAITTFLPVLFVTPNVAANTLPEKEGYFDLVIFEEANQFPVEPASAIAKLGKQVVICGSNDSYGSETSLLQYALENEVPAVLLHDAQETTAGENMEELPVQEFLVENLEGRFHELEGTNDIEAQHVIRLLNQVKQTPQRIYPSVGIVTLTVEQRDLISYYLLKLKQQNAAGSEKIMQLERNGMGVFFIDELYGQEFDQIIVSGALGVVNLKGALTKKMVFLNTQEGVSRMRMLARKHAQSIHIVHSLPDEQVEKYLAKPSEEGAWLFASLIKLGEALKNNNRELTQTLIRNLGWNRPAKTVKSVFAQELRIALQPYLAADRLAGNQRMYGLPLPLTIQPATAGDAPIIVHPDGFFAQAPHTFAAWEEDQRAKFVKAGIQAIPVWSLNWLKNPTQEARLLASKIIKLDVQKPETGKETYNEAITSK
jgi:hypothetical protein